MQLLSELEALQEPLAKLKFILEYINENDFTPLLIHFPENSHKHVLQSPCQWSWQKNTQTYCDKILINFDTIDMTNAEHIENVESIISLFQKKILTDLIPYDVSSLRRKFRILAKMLPDPLEFEGCDHGETETNICLKEYIRIAEAIRESDDFENSPIDTLEKVILNPHGTVKSVLSEFSLPNEVKSENLKKSFVALVSPSLSGKTQSAFVMKRVRPLYFSLDRMGYNRAISVNFNDLNSHFRYCFEKDSLELFKFIAKLNREDIDIIKEIKQINDDTSILVTKFPTLKFSVLGFLMELIKRSEREFDPKEKCWMQYHAERRSFYYAPRTAIEFMEFIKDKKNYCVFLDDFKDWECNVLIRDVCCDLGLPCVVAGDTIEIANVNKIPDCRFRIKQDFAIVFRLLNYTKFQLNLNDLPQNSEIQADQRSHFEMFFDYLKTAKMLPGILQMLNQEIKNVSMEGPFVYFLNDLLDKISDDIKLKKPSIYKKEKGLFAQMRLYYECAYWTEDSKSGPSSHESFLSEHFYYLENPTERSEYIFLTFPGRPNEDKFFIWRLNSLRVCEYVKTYLNPDELITNLACLSIKTGCTIAYMSYQTYRLNSMMPCMTDTAFVSEEGSRLESKAALTLIESSHRNHVTKSIAFQGQNGINFVKNIVSNLILWRDAPNSLELGIEPDIEQCLEQIKVPFLFNTEIPKLLQDLGSNGAINVGQCTLTSYYEPVDVLFADSESQSIVAECKYWSHPVSFRRLNGMIKDAIRRYTPKILLFFFNKCSKQSTDANTKALKVTCTRNHVNIFRIVNKENYNFEMVPLFTSLKEPKINVIIFEIAEIDTKQQ